MLDINLYARERDRQLHLALRYDAELFDEPRMRELLHQFELVLEQVTSKPSRRIDGISLRTPHAVALLPQPSAPLTAGPQLPVPARVRAVAAATPNAVAVDDGNRTFTYRDLLESATTIHARLARACAPGQTVAVTGVRSFGFVAAMLAILDGGFVLLCVDPTLPRR